MILEKKIQSNFVQQRMRPLQFWYLTIRGPLRHGGKQSNRTADEHRKIEPGLFHYFPSFLVVKSLRLV